MFGIYREIGVDQRQKQDSVILANLSLSVSFVSEWREGGEGMAAQRTHCLAPRERRIVFRQSPAFPALGISEHLLNSAVPGKGNTDSGSDTGLVFNASDWTGTY